MCGPWVFYDPLRNIAVYRVSSAADGVVVEKVLGAWARVVICDGAGVFKRFVGIRAHTLKDARCLARVYPDSLGARYVLYSPGKIFDYAKRFEGSAARRRGKRHEFARRVRTRARQHWDYDDDELHRFMVTYENAAFDMFPVRRRLRGAHHKQRRRRPLRAPVALRKIRGGLRRRPACWSCRPCQLQDDMGTAVPRLARRDREAI